MLRRKGIYTARIHVPEDVREHIGRDELWRSTLTADAREGKVRASLWEAHFGSLFSELRRSSHRMRRDQIDSLVQGYLAAQLEHVEERLAVDLDAENAHAWVERINDEALAAKVALTQGDLSETLPLARSMMPSAPEVSLRMLARRLLEAKLQVLSAEEQALNGEPLVLHSATPSVSSRTPAAAPVVAQTSSPRLTELVALYAQAKMAGGKWTAKTKHLTESRLLTMVDLIGDKQAHKVTPADMRALQVTLPRVPAGYRTLYPGVTAVQAIERADADGREGRISAKTTNMHIFDLKSVLKWAVKNELLIKSPAGVLEEVKDDSEGRKPFTDDDLRAIFGALEADAKKNAARWWVPHILLYTGARLEEVCQLHAEDVGQQHDVWFFDINREGSKRLKTDNSERIVPVHSRLISLGWLDYVKQIGSGHLFPDLPFKEGEGYSAAFSKWTGRRLRKVGVTDKRKVASHSFRHTMATRLGSAGVSP